MDTITRKTKKLKPTQVNWIKRTKDYLDVYGLTSSQVADAEGIEDDDSLPRRATNMGYVWLEKYKVCVFWYTTLEQREQEVLEHIIEEYRHNSQFI